MAIGAQIQSEILREDEPYYITLDNFRDYSQKEEIVEILRAELDVIETMSAGKVADIEVLLRNGIKLLFQLDFINRRANYITLIHDILPKDRASFSHDEEEVKISGIVTEAIINYFNHVEEAIPEQ